MAFPKIIKYWQYERGISCINWKKELLTHFRSINCQAKTLIRSLVAIKIKKNITTTIEIRVFGNSFLHHQVRIIIGTLVNVGIGKWDDEKVFRNFEI